MTETKPKYINSSKGIVRKNSLILEVSNILKDGSQTTKELAEKTNRSIASIHQVCKRNSCFSDTKQYNPKTSRWETYYTLIEKVKINPPPTAYEKLIDFLKQNPDMKYRATDLSKKLKINYYLIHNSLKNSNLVKSVRIITEKHSVKYYSIK